MIADGAGKAPGQQPCRAGQDRHAQAARDDQGWNCRPGIRAFGAGHDGPYLGRDAAPGLEQEGRRAVRGQVPAGDVNLLLVDQRKMPQQAPYVPWRSVGEEHGRGAPSRHACHRGGQRDVEAAPVRCHHRDKEKVGKNGPDRRLRQCPHEHEPRSRAVRSKTLPPIVGITALPA